MLGFGTLPDDVGPGTVSQVTIAIQDVPSVSFGASDYSATEGGEDALVTVQLSEALAAEVTVPSTSEGGGGATSEDWSGVPVAVIFSAGETSKTFTVVAFDETVEDDGEMVNLGFGTLPSGRNAAAPAMATVTLMKVENVMASCGENDVWCATVHLDGWDTDPPYEEHHITDWGPGSTGWAETDREFTYGGITYEVRWVKLQPDPRPHAANNSGFLLAFREDHIHSPPSEDHIAQWRLHVDDIQLDFRDAKRINDQAYTWLGAEFRPISREGNNIRLLIERTVDEGDIHQYVPVSPNNRPTGDLVVTGSPQVGSTLTMHTSGISDQEGMTHSDIRHSWWIANDRYSMTVSYGATYTVEPKYEGLRAYAKITFTDNAGRREQVTSAKTAIICAESGEIEPCQGQKSEDTETAPAENTAENTAATGRPTISGTAALGETLTANTSDMEDVNGLTNASYSYQWLRNDVSIADATSSTYTVADADVGYDLRVTVSFTDDDDFPESLTSQGFHIQSLQPLYGGFQEVPEEHDGSAPFTVELHFSEEVSLGFAAVRDHVLNLTNGSITKAQRINPSGNEPNKEWTITVQPNGNDPVTIELPTTSNCDDDGAVCTANGKMLSNHHTITVSGPG